MVFILSGNINAYAKNCATPLLYAIGKSHISTVGLLISRGAHLNTVDRQNGWTPLAYAINLGRRDIAAVFLENGAKLNPFDEGIEEKGSNTYW